jgi:pantoate--beta-alanine ligase
VKVLHDAEALEQELEPRRRHGEEIGFVPTMGALHEGHLSLMRRARSRSAAVVVSIFVNPLQFGPSEDFQRYPRDLERDRRLCEAAGVDLIFAPEAARMYPEGFCTSIEVAGLSEVLEGRTRPGHFQGVATVVLKLLNLVRPDRAYFGQKDFQQTVVVRRLVQDLAVPCRIEVEPTVREPDGLAMSSRNRYLGPEERLEAPALYRCLGAMAELAGAGERNVEALRRAGLRTLTSAPRLTLEYLEVVSTDRLETLEVLDRPAAAVIAGRLGTTRLIDNVLLAPRA